MKVRVCHRCGTVVKKSFVKGYPWFCPKHYEDLYGIETDIIESAYPTQDVTPKHETEGSMRITDVRQNYIKGSSQNAMVA